jgi:hypothetical protein
MNAPASGAARPGDPPRLLGSRWTVAAAVAVAALALAAVLAPNGERGGGGEVLVVVDPLAATRSEPLAPALAKWLSRALGRDLRHVVVPSPAAVPSRLWADVGIVCGPDLAALALPEEDFVPVAVGRRRAPYNLRPRSVLVHRTGTPALAEPWREDPTRTILGDTLSLAGCGPACRDGRAPWRAAAGSPGTPACGPDPYDHRPALVALRAGCYRYAVVREWAAERAFASGLLERREWTATPLSVPLPDVAVMAARRWPAADRVRLGEALLMLSRHPESDVSPEELAVRQGLAALDLAGFNPLLEPDFEQVRRQYAACRPRP